MPLSCQPPNALPSTSFRRPRMGRSHNPEATELCVTSESDVPRSVLWSKGNVRTSTQFWSSEQVSILLLQRYCRLKLKPFENRFVKRVIKALKLVLTSVCKNLI